MCAFYEYLYIIGYIFVNGMGNAFLVMDCIFAIMDAILHIMMVYLFFQFVSFKLGLQRLLQSLQGLKPTRYPA